MLATNGECIIPAMAEPLKTNFVTSDERVLSEEEKALIATHFNAITDLMSSMNLRNVKFAQNPISHSNGKKNGKASGEVSWTPIQEK